MFHCQVLQFTQQTFTGTNDFFVNLQTTTSRRILVPDTSPCLFYKFLGYLYSGLLDTRSLSLDDVTEMLALSDKYEVSLTD